ncbi:Nif3-like dinuclear metal center hexameric protein [Rufibacter glacialis]|uniref:GTP cyclohydrolase 1 type 2 homolog n=1 Tax=Rufibacter glacialis TaxID=1259555 RepID=A0A5M8QHT4_9BACT|nr:Nif3-like dinuclear metal center hexameric protein [Rufibacter glacialis]KAA6434383.1 Nif3-like dinuclear metal center hexameric protein [Rufibacter glacialis]GGK69066.1 GTP cyclohydrolase 1 type 2 [Rufibacter glacialis]
MTKIKEVLQVLERYAPPAYQESYDNALLQVGDPEATVTGVLVTLDCTLEVVQEALDRGCNLIVAHHPVIFKPLKNLTGKTPVERILLKALQHQIAIFACHTNLDHVHNGVNRKLCEKLGLQNPKILAPKTQILTKLETYVPLEDTEKVLAALHAAGAGQIGDYSDCSFRITGTGRFTPSAQANPHIGEPCQTEETIENKIEVVFPAFKQAQIMRALLKAHPYEEVAHYLVALENENQEVGAGMVGELETALSGEEFTRHVKESLQISTFRHTAWPTEPIKRVAVCGGAGSFLTRQAKAAGAQVFLTADLKYHDFFEATEHLALVDVGHYESEVYTKELFYDILTKTFSNFAVELAFTHTNPVRHS